jgi:transcriptional regulator with XRE-family HTH domain
MRKSSSPPDLLRKLLRKHRLHDGVYVRVAKRLRVHPSYVSKVAKGKAVSSEVSLALLKELQRIERM